MDRGYLANGSSTAPTAPSSPSGPYPSGGNPASGVPATQPGPWWFHMITEELRAAIVAGGITPAHGQVGQLASALGAMTTGRLLNIRQFLTAGSASYTPSAGTRMIIVRAVAGGGGGAGSPATTSGQFGIGGGGSAGGFAEVMFLISALTTPVPITIGSGGAGSVGQSNGSPGTQTTFGAYISCPPGTGGISQAAVATTATAIAIPGNGQGKPTSTGGTILVAATGSPGSIGMITGTTVIAGGGGPSGFASGAGAIPGIINQISAGVSSTVPGGGGGGAASLASASAQTGGSGGSGGIVVFEYA